MPTPSQHVMDPARFGLVAAALATAFLWLGYGLTRGSGLKAYEPHSRVASAGRWARVESRNGAAFEGGNIGAVIRRASHQYELRLRSDNDDALPRYWRNWFYLDLVDVPTDAPVTLTLTGAGQWHYYLPFYSYDNRVWHQFSEREVDKPTRLTLRMRKRFRQGKVWLARYVPYTYARLNRYLQSIGKHRDLYLGSIGTTPEGRTIPRVTITDPTVKAKRARILIHARTHPGEVGSSFLLEGFMDALLAPTSLARQARQRLIFDIVPMLNVDGVVAGNNRVSPRGDNLEGKWYARSGAPLELDHERVPHEVRLLHATYVALLRQDVPVTMALNLHASGGEPQDKVFFFPHFGPPERGYNAAESALFDRQMSFIRHFLAAQGPRWFNRPPKDGGRDFTAKSVPESWWWRNFQDQVMALTVESAYGHAGPARRWIQPHDMRQLGASMLRAIARYHGLDGHPAVVTSGAILRRPQLEASRR